MGGRVGELHRLGEGDGEFVAGVGGLELGISGNCGFCLPVGSTVVIKQQLAVYLLGALIPVQGGHPI